MTTATDRLTAERHFHDAQAGERARHFARIRTDLLVRDDDYLDHESWIRPAMEQLGPVRGKDVLDYGCGHGMAATVLARRGARVTAFDLSPGYVRETLERAESNGVPVHGLAADAEHLPFADASFDAVWGCAILHHLDLPVALAELKRVLKPGGVAVFCEPWGGNPLLTFARNWLPYPGKHRTRDERPLMPRDLIPIRAVFPGAAWEGFQLVSMIRRIVKWGFVTRTAERLDRLIFRLIPGSRSWCRYLVLRFSRV